MPASLKSPWLEWTVILLIRLMIVLTRLMPLVWARALGRAVGASLYHFNGRMRRVTAGNLELAYPGWTPDMRRVVTRQSVQSTEELMSEMGRVWTQSWTQTAALLEIDGLRSVREPLASGLDVIVLGPHLGNWKRLGMHLATLGKLVALYEPISLKKIDQLVHRGRQCTGGKLLPTMPRGIAELVPRCEPAALPASCLIKSPMTKMQASMRLFFGVECFTPALASNRIKKSGAAPVMGAVLRTEKGFPAVYRPAEPGVQSDDTLEALTAINFGVEKLIAGNERQYQWQYKRFRCRPKGLVDHYHWSAMPLLDEASLKR